MMLVIYVLSIKSQRLNYSGKGEFFPEWIIEIDLKPWRKNSQNYGFLMMMFFCGCGLT